MKSFLRSQKLLERLEHHPQEKALKDSLIVENLFNTAIFQESQIVLFYLPVHGEVDVRELFLKASHKKYALPRMNGNELDMHFVESIDDVEKSKFGLLEPQQHLPKVDFLDLDVVLVPGIVFAEDGHRVGFGKGFYDRLLQKNFCPKIGIAYEFQIVKNIGKESHDIPMDFIITEKRVFTPSI